MCTLTGRLGQTYNTYIMKHQKTILTLTGGGLAPALNATLFGVIREAQQRRYRVLGGMYGWAALGRNGKVVDLTRLDVRSIARVGGTFLRSSRTNLLKQPNGVALAQERLKQWQVDAVVPIGGNDTLGAAKVLGERGLTIVGVPKTIDNDLNGTYWTPGFPSAARYLADFVREIRDDAAYALSRIFLVEAPGRASGWLAASAAFGGADVILPPERPVKLRHFLRAVRDRYERNGNFAVAVISEHATFDDPTIAGLASDQEDGFTVKRTHFITVRLRDRIKAELGVETKALVPANFFETGSPFPEDRETAEQLGRYAVGLVAAGVSGRMASLERIGTTRRFRMKSVLLSAAVRRDRVLDPTFFNFSEFRPTRKFMQYLAPAFPVGYERRDAGYLRLLRKLPH